VSGAYGQLGNEIKELINEYPEWIFLFTDVNTLDITRESEVKNYFDRNKPDFVINCAAYTAVDKAEEDVETAEKVNSLAPGILGRFSKETGARLIHISTDYVFDGEANQPYAEKAKVNPKGIYGKTKLAGEANCLQENPDTVIIRTSWLYSLFGNNFLKTMLRLGNERDELIVVYDQVGTPTYASDLATSILKIIEVSEKKSDKFIPGIYHFSNEGVASWYDFAKEIFEISGMECNIKPVLSEQFPTAAKRPKYSVLDKAKIKNTFGLEIPYWKDSLNVCIGKLIK
jgi:dTDP-4-dehydrorhamnose reductase